MNLNPQPACLSIFLYLLSRNAALRKVSQEESGSDASSGSLTHTLSNNNTDNFPCPVHQDQPSHSLGTGAHLEARETNVERYQKGKQQLTDLEATPQVMRAWIPLSPDAECLTLLHIKSCEAFPQAPASFLCVSQCWYEAPGPHANTQVRMLQL